MNWTFYIRSTDRVHRVMSLAKQEAHRLNHPHIGSGHILLGLVNEGNGMAGRVLQELAVDPETVRSEMERLAPAGRDASPKGRLPLAGDAEKVLQYSIHEARGLDHNYIGTEHVLLGLLREPEGIGGRILRNLGLKLEQVREVIINLLERPSLPRRPGPWSMLFMSMYMVFMLFLLVRLALWACGVCE